jgi:hypothetical protein
MTLCPIALAVGCQKCPVFKICPVKSLIGDQPKDAKPAAKPLAAKATAAAKKARPGPARKKTKGK